MSNKDQLILRTPKQQDYRNPEAILGLNELKQWLDRLPLLRPAQTIGELLDALTAINLQELNPKKRRPLLDSFRQVILTIYPSLELDALKRLSLKKNEREHLQGQITALCMALSDGYKIIVKNALEDNSTRIQNIFFTPLYHALEAASLALLNGYRSYQTAPALLYQDTHQLFILAEHSGLLDQQMDEIHHSPCAKDMGSLYKQTMILSFLDPFRMPTGIATKLYDRLSTLAQHCTMLAHFPDSETQGIFVIDMMADKAPLALFKISPDMKLGKPRAFNTQTMTNKLQAEITVLQSAEQGLSTRNEIDLLSRLIPASQEQVTRKSERSASDRSCKLVFGIDAVNHFLSLNKQDLDQALASSAGAMSDHVLESWVITNESETGLSLTSPQGSCSEASVGDITGILAESSAPGEQNGKLAIIRWLRTDEKNHLNIGIEFILGNQMPALCTWTDTSDNINTFKAIFISSIALNDIPATLLTPKRVYRRDRVIDMNIGNQTRRIKAGFLRDESLSYDRFEFSSLS